jgi:hypothetical protein
LQQKYGNCILEELNQLQYKVKKFTTDELQELIDHIKNDLVRL